MDNIDKEKQYIKNSIYLNLQKKEISELMSKPISKNKCKLKLINRDIINGYLDPQLNKKIMQILNDQNKKSSEFNDQDINNIINKIIVENKKDRESTVEELILDFLFPEELNINNLELPTNFYIVTEERFNKLFEKKDNLIDFKTYDAYLGKEGIFMWIEGDMVTNKSEGQIKDYKKVMYFIENNKYDDLKINKIFLFKNKEKLKEQLYIIIEEGKEKYFEERNVIYKKFGKFYNMINDGNIIGEYINVTKNIKEKKTQLSKSVYEPIEDKRMKNEIERIEKKEHIIKIFLPYLLICFSKIKKLKKGLELEKKNKGLLKILLEIIKSVDNNKIDDIGKKIINFENELKKKEFIYKLSCLYDNRSEVFKNIIEMLLNEFHQEIYVEDKLNPKEKFEDLKNSTFIFDLFFGLRKINKKEVFFNAIDLNTNDTGNEEVKIEDLLIHYKFKEELVLFFPNVLILLIIDNNKLLKLPIELNLEFDNKDNNKYKLKSCIQMSDQFFSFILNDKNDFSKVSFNYDKDNNILTKFENSNIDEINEKMSESFNIFFYENDE